MDLGLPEWVADWARKVPNLKVAPPGPKSKEIIEKDRKYVSHAYDRLFQFTMTRGSGAAIMDADGNVFLDFSAGISVLNAGWGNPVVVKAIKDQADRLVHSLANDAYYDLEADYAELLAKISPGGQLGSTFFGNSGAEAVEAAIKLSRYYTKGSEHIAFMGAYHGRVGNALAMASRIKYKYGHGPYAPGIYFAPYPYCYRCWFNQEYPSCNMLCIDYLEKGILEFGGPSNDLASIFVEPIQGEGGYIVPPKEFLPRMRKLCDDRKCLLVMDEIQSGLARTGEVWECNSAGIIPDILLTGKASGGGIPIGMCIAKHSIADVWRPGSHSSTFGGNGMSVAAGYAQVKYILEHDLMTRSKVLGQHAMKRLNELRAKYEIIGDVRGKGLMIGVEIVKSKKTKEPLYVPQIQGLAWRKGLMMITAGMFGNVFRIAPPIVISQEQLDIGIDIFEQAIKETQAKM
ncbi:MAG: aminotransferase class III-fold pyridoxal phosphate-dependent enzyme [Thermoplasmata archaeon]|nr:aminotransferase class III-fold pyridoxal phosphate-dependent enzyme [Thermoplasmata archaeon]